MNAENYNSDYFEDENVFFEETDDYEEELYDLMNVQEELEMIETELKEWDATDFNLSQIVNQQESIEDTPLEYESEVDYWIQGQINGQIRQHIKIIKGLRRREREQSFKEWKRLGVKIINCAKVAVSGGIAMYSAYMLIPSFGSQAGISIAMKVFFFVNTSFDKGVKQGVKEGLLQVVGTMVSQEMNKFGFVGVFTGFIAAPIVQGMTSTITDMVLRIDPATYNQIEIKSDDLIDQELTAIRRIVHASNGKLSFEDAIEKYNKDKNAIFPNEVAGKLAIVVASTAFANVMTARILNDLPALLADQLKSVSSYSRPFLVGMMMQYAQVSKCIDKLIEYGMTQAGIDANYTLGQALRLPKNWKSHWLGQYIYGQSVRHALSAALSVQSTAAFNSMMSGLTPENIWNFKHALETSATTSLENYKNEINNISDWIQKTPAPLQAELTALENITVEDKNEFMTSLPDVTNEVLEPVIDQEMIRKLSSTQAVMMKDHTSLQELRDVLDHNIKLRHGLTDVNDMQSLKSIIDDSLTRIDVDLRKITQAKQSVESGQNIEQNVDDILGNPRGQSVNVVESFRKQAEDSLSKMNTTIRAKYSNAVPYLKKVLEEQKDAVSVNLSETQRADLQNLISKLETTNSKNKFDDPSLKVLEDIKKQLEKQSETIKKTGDQFKDPSCALTPFSIECQTTRFNIRKDALQEEIQTLKEVSKQVSDVTPVIESKIKLSRDTGSKEALNEINKTLSDRIDNIDGKLSNMQNLLSKIEKGEKLKEEELVSSTTEQTDKLAEELRRKLLSLDETLNSKISEEFSHSALFLESLSQKQTILSEHMSEQYRNDLKKAIESLSNGQSLSASQAEALSNTRNDIEKLVGEEAAVCVLNPTKPECTTESSLGWVIDNTATGAVTAGGFAATWATGAGVLWSGAMAGWTKHVFKKSLWNYDKTYNKGLVLQRMLTASVEIASSDNVKNLINSLKGDITKPDSNHNKLFQAANVMKEMVGILDVARKVGVLDGFFGRGVSR